MFLGEIGFLFLLLACGSEEYTDFWYNWYHCPDLCLIPAFNLLLVLQHECKCQHSGKKLIKNLFHYIFFLKIFFFSFLKLVVSWKTLRNFQVSRGNYLRTTALKYLEFLMYYFLGRLHFSEYLINFPSFPVLWINYIYIYVHVCIVREREGIFFCAIDWSVNYSPTRMAVLITYLLICFKIQWEK